MRARTLTHADTSTYIHLINLENSLTDTSTSYSNIDFVAYLSLTVVINISIRIQSRDLHLKQYIIKS